jgi:hypothetical protein
MVNISYDYILPPSKRPGLLDHKLPFDEPSPSGRGMMSQNSQSLSLLGMVERGIISHILKDEVLAPSMSQLLSLGVGVWNSGLFRSPKSYESTA